MDANGDDDLPPLARRVHPRKRTLFRGVIVYGGGAYSFDCTIRDLSKDGARLGLTGREQLPANFYLINLRAHTAHEAVLMRHTGTEAGVRLLNSLDVRTLTDPALNYLKRLHDARQDR